MVELGRVPVEQWRDVAQAGELQWWINKASGDRDAYTEGLWCRLGFDRAGFDGLRVMDVGCGPTVQSRWFHGADIVALEPLADSYMQNVPWHNLGCAKAVYSVPAEQMVEEERGKIDVVLSINALDHAHDFYDVIKNISAYLKPHGLAFLSFDMHEAGDHLHPMALTVPYCEECYDSHGFAIHKRAVGIRGWLDTWSAPRGSYGGGLAYHWWLQKCR